MIATYNIGEATWLHRSQELLRAASTPHGIKASLADKDNYSAIFARDAIMSGIVGLLLQDEVITASFCQSIERFRDLQGEQGQIASNYTMDGDDVAKVSYGTLSPKIDSCTWYLVGVGLLVREGLIDKTEYRASVEKTVDLLEAIEFNGKHLMNIPRGGNWADEYVYEGYVLYDQVLRAWGLSLVSMPYGVEAWSGKSREILHCIEAKFSNDQYGYLNSSIYPGGAFEKFDLAAHTLLCVAFGDEYDFCKRSLDWVTEEFLERGKLPPAFYPIIKEGDPEWQGLRKYHLFEFKNKPHHYHNGGIWWIWLGWLSVGLALRGKTAALNRLHQLSFDYLDGLDNFEFDEYVASDDQSLNGTKQLCYTAAGIAMLTLTKSPASLPMLFQRNSPLIKEAFELKREYFTLSAQLVQEMKAKSLLRIDKLVIGICGESGSGKSVTARCLQIELEKSNLSSLILHQDSYFKLPPRQNHEKRKSDLEWVGPGEVRMDLLQSHIARFKAGATDLTVPAVDYKTNQFNEQRAYIKPVNVLIVEGTYAQLLEDLDYTIFIDKTYQASLPQRQLRSREVYDPFVEKVLAIEQKIIRPLGATADVRISQDYSLSTTDENR